MDEPAPNDTGANDPVGADGVTVNALPALLLNVTVPPLQIVTLCQPGKKKFTVAVMGLAQCGGDNFLLLNLQVTDCPAGAVMVTLPAGILGIGDPLGEQSILVSTQFGTFGSSLRVYCPAGTIHALLFGLMASPPDKLASSSRVTFWLKLVPVAENWKSCVLSGTASLMILISDVAC